MYKYNTAPILSTAEAPFKTGTMDFITEAIRNNDEHIIHGLVNLLTKNSNFIFGGSTYITTTPYALWGCVVNSGSTCEIGEGAIIFNGELFYVPASSTLSAPSTGCSMSISTSQYTVNADPVTLSDTSTHNLHDIRTLTASLGTSGLFTLDQVSHMINTPNIIQYFDAGFASWGSPEEVDFSYSYSQSFSSTFNTVNTMTFNFTGAVPGVSARLQATFTGAGTATLAFSKPSGCDVYVIGDNTNLTTGGAYIIYVTYVGLINSRNVVEVEILRQTNY